MKSIILIFAFIAYASSKQYITDQVVDCGSRSGGKIDHLSINNCLIVPCAFNLESYYGYEIEFTPSRNSGTVDLVVEVIYGDFLPIHLTLTSEIAGFGLIANQPYKLEYKFSIPEEINFTSGKQLALKFMLEDRDEHSIVFCGAVEAYHY